MEESIENLQGELIEARERLQHTVADVNQKVDAAGAQLRPDLLLKRHLPLIACVSGLLGFAAGHREDRSSAAAMLLLGTLLGAAWFERRNDGNGNGNR